MNWDKLEIALLGGAALIAVAGKYLAIPAAISIGMGIFSFDVCLIGLEAVITRKMKWGISAYVSETYQGLAAISLGVILVIAGLGFGALTAAQAMHREQSLFEMIFSRPGFVLMPVGAIMFLRGFAGVIGSPEWNQTAVTRVLNGVFERLAMLVLLLLGMMCLSLGALEIVAPGTFHQLFSVVWQALLGLIGIH